ncbi:GNAT family N-acetyltransferase [Thiocystis violacea]|uniref:GNAT family N-acetyltransferase n=1 Tax=Thiocystis violacea TaxID=13725 RepID=UPI00190629C5|nr:GNAT family N-acetyltransferase [Thiocystis violacea]MBK1718728.1 GNAT family N-acetyltransferase [Thiocystis violacea]
MSDLSIRRCSGAAIAPHLDDLARLRLQVFRDWPYLYDGDMDYEKQYLDTYSRSPESLFVLVLDGDRVVGASTGVPMADETPDFKRPFLSQGHDPERIFYLGESVLLPEYRGRGLGARFFVEREGFARELGRFAQTAFCAVDRPPDHPRRPPGHVPLDAFWTRRGYVRHPELRTRYTWKDLDEAEPSPKPMIFWLKRLDGQADRAEPIGVGSDR